MARLVVRGRAQGSAADEELVGGTADGRDPSSFDPEALAEGVAHEREHTDDESVAREIAMDHLAEDPDYYQRRIMRHVGGWLTRLVEGEDMTKAGRLDRTRLALRASKKNPRVRRWQRVDALSPFTMGEDEFAMAGNRTDPIDIILPSFGVLTLVPDEEKYARRALLRGFHKACQLPASSLVERQQRAVEILGRDPVRAWHAVVAMSVFEQAHLMGFKRPIVQPDTDAGRTVSMKERAESFVRVLATDPSVEDGEVLLPGEALKVSHKATEALGVSASGRLYIDPEAVLRARLSGEAELVHNHPSGGTLSLMDVDLAVKMNLRAIHAAGNDLDGGIVVYTLRRNTPVWPSGVADAWHQHQRLAEQEASTVWRRKYDHPPTTERERAIYQRLGSEVLDRHLRNGVWGTPRGSVTYSTTKIDAQGRPLVRGAKGGWLPDRPGRSSHGLRAVVRRLWKGAQRRLKDQPGMALLPSPKNPRVKRWQRADRWREKRHPTYRAARQLAEGIVADIEHHMGRLMRSKGRDVWDTASKDHQGRTRWYRLVSAVSDASLQMGGFVRHVTGPGLPAVQLHIDLRSKGYDPARAAEGEMMPWARPMGRSWYRMASISANPAVMIHSVVDAEERGVSMGRAFRGRMVSVLTHEITHALDQNAWDKVHLAMQIADDLHAGEEGGSFDTPEGHTYTVRVVDPRNPAPDSLGHSPEQILTQMESHVGGNVGRIGGTLRVSRVRDPAIMRQILFTAAYWALGRSAPSGNANDADPYRAYLNDPLEVLAHTHQMMAECRMYLREHPDETRLWTAWIREASATYRETAGKWDRSSRVMIQHALESVGRHERLSKALVSGHFTPQGRWVAPYWRRAFAPPPVAPSPTLVPPATPSQRSQVSEHTPRSAVTVSTRVSLGTFLAATNTPSRWVRRHDPERFDAARARVRQARGVPGLLYLGLRWEGDAWSVVHHDGRHRSVAAMDAGFMFGDVVIAFDGPDERVRAAVRQMQAAGHLTARQQGSPTAWVDLQVRGENGGAARVDLLAKGASAASRGLALLPSRKDPEVRRWQRMEPAPRVDGEPDGSVPLSDIDGLRSKIADCVKLSNVMNPDPNKPRDKHSRDACLEVRRNSWASARAAIDIRNHATSLADSRTSAVVFPATGVVRVQDGFLTDPTVAHLLRSLDKAGGGEWRVEATDYQEDASGWDMPVNVDTGKTVSEWAEQVQDVTATHRARSSGTFANYSAPRPYHYPILRRPQQLTWYHATPVRALPTITQEGLLPPRQIRARRGADAAEGWAGAGHFSTGSGLVYLTASKEDAIDIAKALVVQHGQPAAVMEVDGRALRDQSGIVADEDATHVSAGGGFFAGDVLDSTPPWAEAASWFGRVAYRGRIAPEHLREIGRVTPDEYGEPSQVEMVKASFKDDPRYQLLPSKKRPGARRWQRVSFEAPDINDEDERTPEEWLTDRTQFLVDRTGEPEIQALYPEIRRAVLDVYQAWVPIPAVSKSVHAIEMAVNHRIDRINEHLGRADKLGAEEKQLEEERRILLAAKPSFNAFSDVPLWLQADIDDLDDLSSFPTAEDAQAHRLLRAWFEKGMEYVEAWRAKERQLAAMRDVVTKPFAAGGQDKRRLLGSAKHLAMELDQVLDDLGSGEESINPREPLDHWGSAHVGNVLARAVCAASGRDWMWNPRTGDIDRFDPSEGDRDLGHRLLRFTRDQLAEEREKDQAAGGRRNPFMYRGMGLSAAVAEQVREVVESGPMRLRLTGASSFTPSRQVAVYYSDSNWTAAKTATSDDDRAAVVMEIARDPVFDEHLVATMPWKRTSLSAKFSNDRGYLGYEIVSALPYLLVQEMVPPSEGQPYWLMRARAPARSELYQPLTKAAVIRNRPGLALLPSKKNPRVRRWVRTRPAKADSSWAVQHYMPDVFPAKWAETRKRMTMKAVIGQLARGNAKGARDYAEAALSPYEDLPDDDPGLQAVLQAAQAALKHLRNRDPHFPSQTIIRGAGKPLPEAPDELEDDLWDLKGDPEAQWDLLRKLGGERMQNLPASLEVWSVELDGEQAWVEVADDTYSDVFTDAAEWVRGADVAELYGDAEEAFNRQFWEFPSILYHSTQPEAVEGILETGLEARMESRGMDNRDMGHAVFTTTEPGFAEMGGYGAVTFVIDTAAMKADGYMPRVGMESPLIEQEQREALAHAFGSEVWEKIHMDASDAASGGYDPDTVAVYDDIPLKYLELWRGQEIEQVAELWGDLPMAKAISLKDDPRYQLLSSPRNPRVKRWQRLRGPGEERAPNPALLEEPEGVQKTPKEWIADYTYAQLDLVEKNLAATKPEFEEAARYMIRALSQDMPPHEERDTVAHAHRLWKWMARASALADAFYDLWSNPRAPAAARRAVDAFRLDAGYGQGNFENNPFEDATIDDLFRATVKARRSGDPDDLRPMLDEFAYCMVHSQDNWTNLRDNLKERGHFADEDGWRRPNMWHAVAVAIDSVTNLGDPHFDHDGNPVGAFKVQHITTPDELSKESERYRDMVARAYKVSISPGLKDLPDGLTAPAEEALPHWGSADPTNRTVRQVLHANGRPWLRDPSIGFQAVPVARPASGDWTGAAMRRLAQRRLREVSRARRPSFFRGMGVDPEQVPAIMAAKRLPLTGVTAFSMSPSVGEHYASSEWTKGFGDSPTSVVIEMPRDDVSEAFTVAWRDLHSMDGAHEVLSTLPWVHIESADFTPGVYDQQIQGATLISSGGERFSAMRYMVPMPVSLDGDEVSTSLPYMRSVSLNKINDDPVLPPDTPPHIAAALTTRATQAYGEYLLDQGFVQRQITGHQVDLWSTAGRGGKYPGVRLQLNPDTGGVTLQPIQVLQGPVSDPYSVPTGDPPLPVGEPNPSPDQGVKRLHAFSRHAAALLADPDLDHQLEHHLPRRSEDKLRLKVRAPTFEELGTRPLEKSSRVMRFNPGVALMPSKTNPRIMRWQRVGHPQRAVVKRKPPIRQPYSDEQEELEKEERERQLELLGQIVLPFSLDPWSSCSQDWRLSSEERWAKATSDEARQYNSGRRLSSVLSFVDDGFYRRPRAFQQAILQGVMQSLPALREAKSESDLYVAIQPAEEALHRVRKVMPRINLFKDYARHMAAAQAVDPLPPEVQAWADEAHGEIQDIIDTRMDYWIDHVIDERGVTTDRMVRPSTYGETKVNEGARPVDREVARDHIRRMAELELVDRRCLRIVNRYGGEQTHNNLPSAAFRIANHAKIEDADKLEKIAAVLDASGPTALHVIQRRVKDAVGEELPFDRWSSTRSLITSADLRMASMVLNAAATRARAKEEANVLADAWTTLRTGETIERHPKYGWAQNLEQGSNKQVAFREAWAMANDVRYRAVSHARLGMPVDEYLTEAVDDLRNQGSRLEDTMDDLIHLKAMGYSMAGHHWGTASGENATARAIQAGPVGRGEIREPQPDGTWKVVPVEAMAIHKLRGHCYRRFAQEQLAATPVGMAPRVYRGMAVPEKVAQAMMKAHGELGSAARVPLTGATAFSMDPSIADRYTSSEWTQGVSFEGSVPMLITLERSQRFDDSVGFYHVDKQTGTTAYEVVSAMPHLEITDMHNRDGVWYVSARAPEE